MLDRKKLEKSLEYYTNDLEKTKKEQERKTQEIEKLKKEAQPYLKRSVRAKQLWYASILSFLPLSLLGLINIALITIPISLLVSSTIAKQSTKRKYDKSYRIKLETLAKEHAELQDRYIFGNRKKELTITKLSQLEPCSPQLPQPSVFPLLPPKVDEEENEI